MMESEPVPVSRLLFEVSAEAGRAQSGPSRAAVEADPRARRIASPSTAGEQLAYAYESVRLFTHRLADPLPVEDQVVQSMENVSPTKWHLAHTSWFFERFILHGHVPDYEPYHETYYYLFNSYYNGAGPQHCRASRGLISRPTVREVNDYRRIIDDRMIELITQADDAQLDVLRPLIVLGLNHEQQHQELMLTDIKHIYSSNPLLPAYEGVSSSRFQASGSNGEPEAAWVGFEGGIHEIGHTGAGFHFDNETPRHKTYVHPFAMASRPVTNGEFLAFVEDGGYEKPDLWLSMGYDIVQREGWKMPLYWYRDGGSEGSGGSGGSGGEWMQYTLAGPRVLDMAEPVSHLSYFEAEAFARWCGLRLPTEAEWEIAARDEPMAGNFAESMRCHPAPLHECVTHEDASDDGRLQRCFGDVWEWTQSQYEPYPGYKPLAGTLGEYNGKFMCNQFVLRGGSCATSQSHIRPTYRNFFAPDARWQFTGLRLARDA